MLYLVIATVFNVAAFAAMKYTEGFTLLYPSVLTIILYFIGVVLFAVAAKRVDVSMIYVVSFGLGTVALSLIGYAFFQESFSLAKVVAIIAVITGVVILSIPAKQNKKKPPQYELEEAS